VLQPLVLIAGVLGGGVPLTLMALAFAIPLGATDWHRQTRRAHRCSRR